MRPLRTAALLTALLSIPVQTLWAQSGPAPVYRVPIRGTIELGLAPFVERSIRAAEDARATAIVLEIDTPGGRVDAAERIADAIRDSDVPVYAFIDRRAFSAGALISLATSGIYMRPGSVIGAATPVNGQGEKAPEKIVSAMRSEMRALAEQAGLDPDVAEAMVDESVEIEGVVEAGRLLTLTTVEAVALGYAEEVEDLDEALAAIGAGASAEQVQMTTNWAEAMVRFLSHPVVAPFLLSLGFLGLIAEIKTPGLGLPGAAGFLALSLFFGSHLILGLAGWEDLLVFGAGVLLLVVEAFVVPGFGVFGVLGILGIFGGLFMSLIGDIPTLSDLAQAGGVVSVTLLIVLVTAWALLRHLPHSANLAKRGILLSAATDRSIGYVSGPVRPELVGRVGTAATALRPSGVGLFDGERVDVVSETGWVPEGERIEIVTWEGYRHVVRPASDESAGSA